jgi:hypothetical protein
MLEPGDMKEISDETRKIQFDLVALQEIIWEKRERVDKTECSLLVNGLERRTAMLRTSFLLQKGLKQFVGGFSYYE